MSKMDLLVLLSAIVLPAAWIDFRHRRIPNELCLAGILLGLAYHVLCGGLPGAGLSFLAFILAFVVGIPLWLLGWMGAGDVKLVSAVGAIVGMNLVLPVLAGVAIAGGAVAFVYLLAMRLQYEPLYVIMMSSAFSRNEKGIQAESVQKYVPLTRKGIPYAIPVALGSLSAIVYLS